MDKLTASVVTLRASEYVSELASLPSNADKKIIYKTIMRIYGFVVSTCYWEEKECHVANIDYWKSYSAMMYYLCDEIKNIAKKYEINLPQ